MIGIVAVVVVALPPGLVDGIVEVDPKIVVCPAAVVVGDSIAVAVVVDGCKVFWFVGLVTVVDCVGPAGGLICGGFEVDVTVATVGIGSFISSMVGASGLGFHTCGSRVVVWGAIELVNLGS